MAPDAACAALHGVSLCTWEVTCVRHDSGDVRGFRHGQGCWRQRATLVGFTPASPHSPTLLCEPPVAALGRTGPKARGRVWQTLCVSPPPPSGLPLPQPHLSGTGFRNQVCALSGLGGLQPDRGSRGGFWARALPACGRVLSVIDSPASGWLFFFFFPTCFNLHLGRYTAALRSSTHPTSRKRAGPIGSGRLRYYLLFN